MNYEEFKEKAQLVKDNDQYTIYDIAADHMTLSLTELKSKQSTNGHSHDGIEEFYLFREGSGKMVIGDKEIEVSKGDVVHIPCGDFHKVINTEDLPLVFFAVFEKYNRSEANYTK